MCSRTRPATFQILPWRGEIDPTARMFCDIMTPDGQPAIADPRNVLKRTLAKAADAGFTFYTHPEIEFYLLKSSKFGKKGPSPSTRPATSTTCPAALPTTSVAARCGCSKTSASRSSSATTRVARAERDRPPVRGCAHHGRQHHDLPHRDQGGGDRAGRLRHVHAEAADRPPRIGHAHARVALRGRHERVLRGRRQVPAVEDGPPVHRRPAAHAPEITAVTNQFVNSYKRLWGGDEAPSFVTWGHNNRSALVRVPLYKPNKGQSARVEYRAIDSAANPYLSFSLMLAAGLKGIRRATTCRRRPRTTCGC
jgi:glutamine synthetase